MLAALLARANALIDDHGDAWAEMHGLTPAAIAAAHPRLVHCLVTPFGQGAPREWQNARPINVMNAGGWAWHSPSEASPDKPPLKGAGRFMSDYDAGLDAALATLASLHRQRHKQLGQFIDISEQQVQINRVDCVLGRMLAGEEEPNHDRTRYDMGGPATSFAAKDGYIYLFMTSKAHWLGLCRLMGDPPWARDYPADWLEFQCTPERVRAFRAQFAPWAAGQDKLAIAEAGQKLGVAIVPVNSAADLPHNPQFIHRGFFQRLPGGPAAGFGDAPWPTMPYKLSATPVRLTSPPPALGADQLVAHPG
jgi:crotonobetainyl-CoA:carnitine CoA-transferase CaiB-like acyl-CoA transferase